ncbi:ankyrin repeat domain-containing protein [Oceanobacillus sp. FSL K6-0118]|uniref:ankyrin repeat domain-containing protein n=1 Tax=Oceanobacillus sp. FSL K6-0118 TaxID=2921418 RepID=UPI0030FBFA60
MGDEWTIDYLRLLKENDVSGLEEFLKTHDVNEEVQGQSLLYLAVFYNRYDIVKRLIEHGADVDHKDTCGRTPLSSSLFFNYIGISKLLLDSGSRIESTSMDRAIFGWNNRVQIESINLLKQFGWVNLYLDDLRDIPDGFVGAKTIEHAVDIFENYKVHILSLNHNLGVNEEGNLAITGYDLVKQLCGSGIRPANRIYLHTDNVIERENMHQTLLAVQRRGFIDLDIEIYSYPFVKDSYSGYQ